MSWEPTQAQLRAGETPDVSAHAARNLDQLRRGIEDGMLELDDLSAERRAQLSAD